MIVPKIILLLLAEENMPRFPKKDPTLNMAGKIGESGPIIPGNHSCLLEIHLWQDTWIFIWILIHNLWTFACIYGKHQWDSKEIYNFTSPASPPHYEVQPLMIKSRKLDIWIPTREKKIEI